MLNEEKKYEFRKRLLQVNRPDIRDWDAFLLADEYSLGARAKLYIPKDEIVYTAARDFLDFMYVSMGTSAGLCFNADEADIVVALDESYEGYKSYRLTVTAEGIRILAHDGRGAAQALYHLEDRMRTRRAPFLKHGTTERSPLYSPRMVHSGYRLDEYPDEHLLQIAKAGMDAILVYVRGVNKTRSGFLDFNELISRAARHGLDVYAYSEMRVFVHPDAPDAWEQNDAAYGELFRQCPGFKGVVLVGESIGIPTKDPNAAPCPYYENNTDGIPTGKASADMWPCMDYADWLELLKSVIRPIKPDADIVFWTYNWGNKPEEHRVNLIRTLPRDISLLVTFEMFHKYNIGDAVGYCADYTLSFEGPGAYFKSEAEAAKARGIRLYAMTNTAGLTWDMGMIPYEPMPYQWIKRYKAMKECRDLWGLCGLMESHHFGFWPSFVSEVAKEAFDEGGEDCENALANALKRHYGAEHARTVDKALALWSEAITYYIPSNEDQYGAFRTGPAYPFNLNKIAKQPGFEFTLPTYPMDNVGNGSLSGMRIGGEIASLDHMLSLMQEGQLILESIAEPNEELAYLVNFGRYLVCYVQTGVNAKRWHRYVMQLKSESDPVKLEGLIGEAEALLKGEYANVEAAIPCVRKDSRLGWEPMQEYRCRAEHLQWKLRQLEYVLNTELPMYGKSLYMTVKDTNFVVNTFTP